MNDLYDVDREKPSMLGKYFLGAELETILAYYTYSKLLHLFRYALSCSLYPKMNHFDIESFKPYRLEWRTLNEFINQLFLGTLYPEKADEYLLILPKLSFDPVLLNYFGEAPPKTMFTDFLTDPPEAMRLKRLWNLFFLMAECLELIEKRQNLDAVKQFPKFLDSTEQIFDLIFSLDLNVFQYFIKGLEFIFSQKDKVELFFDLSSNKWAFNPNHLFSGMGFWLGIFVSQLSSETADDVFLKKLLLNIPNYMHQSSIYTYEGLNYLAKKQPFATDAYWNDIQKLIENFFIELHDKQVLSPNLLSSSQNILEALKSVYDLITHAVTQFGLLNNGLQIYLNSILRIFKYDILLPYLIEIDLLEIYLFLKQGTLTNIFLQHIQDFYHSLISLVSPFLSVINEHKDLLHLVDERFYQRRCQHLAKNHEKIIQDEFLIDKKINYLQELKGDVDEKKQKAYAVALYTDFQKASSIECEQLFQNLYSNKIYFDDFSDLQDFSNLFDKTMKSLLSQKQGLILRRQSLTKYLNLLEKWFLNPITLIQSQLLDPSILEQKALGNYLLVVKETEVWLFDRSQKNFQKIEFFDVAYLLSNYSLSQNHSVLLSIDDIITIEEKSSIHLNTLNFSQDPEVIKLSNSISPLRNTNDYLHQYAVLMANLNWFLDLKLKINNLFADITSTHDTEFIQLQYFKVRNAIATLIPEKWKDFENKLLINHLIDKTFLNELLSIINHKIENLQQESNQLEAKLTQFYFQENLEAFYLWDYHLTNEGAANSLVVNYYQNATAFFNYLEKNLCMDSFNDLSGDEKSSVTQQLNSLLVQLNSIQSELNMRVLPEISLDNHTPRELYQLKLYFFDVVGIDSRWHWHDLRVGYTLSKTGYAIKIEKILKMKDYLFGKFDSFIQQNLSSAESYKMDSYQQTFLQPIQTLELKGLYNILKYLQAFFEKVENYPSGFNVLERMTLVPFKTRIEIIKAYFKFHNLFFFYFRSDVWKPFLIKKYQQFIDIKNTYLNDLRQQAVQAMGGSVTTLDLVVYGFMQFPQYLQQPCQGHNTYFQQHFYLELSKQLQDILTHRTTSDIVLRLPKIFFILLILRNKTLQIAEVTHQKVLANVKNIQKKIFLNILAEADDWELQLGLQPGIFSQYVYLMASELFTHWILSLQLPEKEEYHLIDKSVFILERLKVLNERKTWIESEKNHLDQKLGLISQFRQEVNDYINVQHKGYAQKVNLRKTYLDILPVLEKYQKYRHYPTLMPLTTTVNRELHTLYKELSALHVVQDDLNIPELLDFTEAKLLGEQATYILNLNSLQNKIDDLNIFAGQSTFQVCMEQKAIIQKIYQKHASLIVHELTHSWKNCSFIYEQYFFFLSSTLKAAEQGIIDDLYNTEGVENHLVSSVQDKLFKVIKLVEKESSAYQFLCKLWQITQQFNYYLDEQETLLQCRFHEIESYTSLKLKKQKIAQLEALIANEKGTIDERLQAIVLWMQKSDFKNTLLAHHQDANGIFEKCWQFIYLFLEWLGLIKSRRHEIFSDFSESSVEKINLQLSRQSIFSPLTSRLTVQELQKQQSAIFIN